MIFTVLHFYCYAECRYAECCDCNCYTECCCAECHGAAPGLATKYWAKVEMASTSLQLLV
jgi:hypothetical protein